MPQSPAQSSWAVGEVEGVETSLLNEQTLKV